MDIYDLFFYLSLGAGFLMAFNLGPMTLPTPWPLLWAHGPSPCGRQCLLPVS